MHGRSCPRALQVTICHMTFAQRPVPQRQTRLHGCAVDTLHTWSPTARKLLVLFCCPAVVQSPLSLQAAGFHDRNPEVLSAWHCRSARSERSRVSTVVISPRMARLPVGFAACTIADGYNAPLLRLMLHVLLCRMRFGRQCSCTSWATALMCMCMEGGLALARSHPSAPFHQALMRHIRHAIAGITTTYLTNVGAKCRCRRYRLQNHSLAADNPAQELLADINTAESDYEARADAFGNATLSPDVGESA